jgi:N-acetylneuraminic acid mutarotase
MVAAVKYWGPNYEIIRLDSLGWHTTSPFNIARAGHTSVVNNGYIYVIGGSCTTQQWMNDVQYAPINPDGSLGSWQNTTPLNTPRNYHTSVVNNGYVYVIGGNANEGNGTGYDLNDVQYAKFNADGTVGAWQSTTPFNPPGRCEHTSVVYNGYLYVMQGFAGSAASPCPDMQYAPINADGSVGTWQSTSTFSPASWGLSSAVWNGRIYSMGGWNQDSNGNYYDLNDVQYSLINSDGSLGNWQQSASQLNPPLGSFGLVAFNSYLFITGGGIFPSEYLNSVKYVTINSDGGLGSWQNAPSFNNGRANHTSVVNNGYLYVLGGSNATTYFNDVQYLNITKNITIK